VSPCARRERLSFLGVELDATANGGEILDRDIAAGDSSVASSVVGAREELIAARGARDVLRETRNYP
jgi:acetate kinase